MYGAPYGDDRPTERDLAGTPLAGGLFAVIYSLKGDLDYFAKCLKLRHYNRNEMCDFCCCTRVGPRGMLYNNFAPDCMWKTMGFDELTWRANYNGKFLHWVFNLPRGLSLHARARRATRHSPWLHAILHWLSALAVMLHYHAR